ncbi:ABC transporter ATP-binding protein [Agrococcus baldri]|uniref:Multidrug ABC transporter ATP-binding protein n=1 Tax=Agrococcus baldri TaxID=153730 RepID=A0AA87RE89_9MICO|nr:ABC transporter ATP-binding protein [Agrococcus baldri]GEK78986.1 multidrug ABC transporter ATP-binding protein [Agrococcus baldri]
MEEQRPAVPNPAGGREDAESRAGAPEPIPASAHPVFVDPLVQQEQQRPAPDAGGIVVDAVARSFGAVRAVRQMSFHAKPGRVTGLIGPNGAGKTTLLLMLASLLAPDTGTIRIDGADPVRNPRAVRRAMGWMPDVLGTWRTLSPRVALTTVGRLHGLPRAAARVRADELLAQARLDELANRPSRVLSRGQQQRLGLARALVHRPRVLLLDEPAAGLDPTSRIELRQLLRGFAAEGGTVLISSHDLSELDELAEDAVFVDRGEVVGGERLVLARQAAREWRVRALDPRALSYQLAHLGVAFDRVRIEGELAYVALDTDEDAADVLARLVRAGVAITHFAPAVGDIERTYLSLSEGSR